LRPFEIAYENPCFRK